MKNLLTIKTQRKQWKSSLPKNGKRLVLITSKEEPQRFIVMEMQVETNVINKGNRRFTRVKNVLIRKKSVSVISGMKMLRLLGNYFNGS